MQSSAGERIFAFTRSARSVISFKTATAASLLRQPVATSRTTPCPSRYFAVYVDAWTRIRSDPSRPVVTSAVRVLPPASFQRATGSPLRMKTSDPLGKGFVNDFRKTAAMLIPFFSPKSALFPLPIPGSVPIDSNRDFLGIHILASNSDRQ